MARDAEITLDWADGTYRFALKWGQLMQLQEACDAGPYVVHRRIADGSWKVEDISHTIRLGLIGGGMAPVDALKLVRSYVEARPPMENLLYAQAILQAALAGAPDEPAQKKRPRKASGLTTSPTEKSALPASSEPAAH